MKVAFLLILGMILYSTEPRAALSNPKPDPFLGVQPDKLAVERRVDESGDLKLQAGLEESELNDSTLSLFGASY